MREEQFVALVAMIRGLIAIQQIRSAYSCDRPRLKKLEEQEEELLAQAAEVLIEDDWRDMV